MASDADLEMDVMPPELFELAAARIIHCSFTGTLPGAIGQFWERCGIVKRFLPLEKIRFQRKRNGKFINRIRIHSCNAAS